MFLLRTEQNRKHYRRRGVQGLSSIVCNCTISRVSTTDINLDHLYSSSRSLYQSCGILGATVMPHSLYLGSGIVQSRLRDFDSRRNNADLPTSDSDSDAPKYRPSLSAIRSCLNYSIIELALSLMIFALFVNSAILIVSGASLSNLPQSQTSNADLFSIHDLLSKNIAPVAGTIFALALLLSGTSAGIICTIAGQMVSEGQLSWKVKPWVRRLMTRAISIIPSIIIAGAVGRDGLGRALEGSQVALSIILPFVSAPLIYFTFSAKVMTVPVEPAEDANGDSLPSDSEAAGARVVVLKNNWLTTVFAVLVWLIITVMNIALLVLMGLGQS
jgi:metal iron transporter